ncbi:ABC transporter ATP-binding protein, partial [Micromonospora sp. KC606]
MSAVPEQKSTTPAETPKRLPPGRAGGGPPWMGAGMPAEKSLKFGPSARRLLGRLRPHRPHLAAIVGLAVASVAATVTGPKILGHATDIIFAGVIGRQLPAGNTV